jgi:hypothetical protein
MPRRRATTPVCNAPPSLLDPAYDRVIQPLTALLLRLEVLQDLAQTGELDDLRDQIAAVQASAGRLAAQVEAIRRELA